MAVPENRFVNGDVRLHLRVWTGEGVPFLLLHGLASNSRTWDLVARRLSAAGHAAAALDQRGHGESDKPDAGYDFETVTADLARVLDALGWERPIVVGQSWGGNVVLEFGARYPGRARGLGFVDGGFLDPRSRPGATWERAARELKPPDLLGKPEAELRRLIRERNPDWAPEAVDGAMGNFEILPDGTVRPWLTLDRHMTILWALWNQSPSEIYSRVREPVVLCATDGGRFGLDVRTRQVEAAQAGLKRAKVHWFPDTSHDIHLHRPEELSRVFLEELRDGIWADR